MASKVGLYIYTQQKKKHPSFVCLILFLTVNVIAIILLSNKCEDICR